MSEDSYNGGVDKLEDLSRRRFEEAVRSGNQLLRDVHSEAQAFRAILPALLDCQADLQIDPEEALLLIHLLHEAKGGASTTIAIPELSRRMGISESSVKRAKDSLVLTKKLLSHKANTGRRPGTFRLDRLVQALIRESVRKLKE